ncbi:MAG: hypothetical protein ACU83N_04780 [Gammaproteobacteria bacterium]
MVKKVLLFIIGLWWVAGHSAPLKPEQVPEPLKPWINWVLLDNPERACPFLYDHFEHKLCGWPSRLTLALYDRQGHFTIAWKVYQESWVGLPGNAEHWPLNVTVNQEPALVIEKNKQPAIKLAAGSYQISGDFIWDRIPDNLAIPTDTGLISLKINDKSIRSPTLKQGQLWLKSSDSGSKKPDNIQNSLDIQVFRKIVDEVPLQVVTLLELQVAGEQREVKLAHPLLQGFIPMRLTSPLPARLEPDGQLLVQVRPGRWQIQIDSRNVREQPALPLALQSEAWPKTEIWVFEARPSLRVVEIENLTAIDPNQTNLPQAWKNFPAYSIRQGEKLVFRVIRRGDPEAEPNQLNLARTLWLDFDGGGYTVNDKITGLLTRGWRLDATPDMHLGKVSLDGENQLVTRLPGTEREGVEVRKGAVSLDADSRIPGALAFINAVGWEQSFHQVKAELNLPPGWRLLAASGVDNVPDSWIARWTLLDLFVVLIASLATARLWNHYWGGLALITLVLIWHEPGAPQFVWLNILAAIALLRVLPEGKFKTVINWYRNAAWLGLVVIAIPFMVAQVRIGLYPQLEKPWQSIQPPVYGGVVSVPAAPEPEIMEQQQPLRKSLSSAMDAASQLEPGYDFATDRDKAVNLERIDPGARIQTGPGLPQWQWHKIHLSWNGSVDASQQLRLWYLPPVTTMLLNFLRVLMIAGLALLMFGRSGKLFKHQSSVSGFSGLILIPALLWPGPEAFADLPDKAMLDELKARMLEAPECIPGCAQIPRMQLSISDSAVVITLQVHTQQAVALPLPADYEQWFPNEVLTDGTPAQALLSAEHVLWLNLEAGLHEVVMRGIPPSLSKFVLPLRLKPNRVDIDSAGWQVSGVHENGLADHQLQFTKIQKEASPVTQKRLEPGVLPPFVRIERTVQLGLDWRITSRIIRVSPRGSAIVLSFPLQPGESVTTAGVRVENNHVLVNMTPDQNVMQWQSTLEKTETIRFKAADTDQWIEVWKADVSPIWHIDTAGIAMMHLNRQGYWMPEWRPWPGEELSFKISRPEPIAGQTLTIENSRLMLKPGKRSRQAELEIDLTSSHGAQHTLMLPERAELETVEIDGNSQPIRQKGRSVTLPIHPGKQHIRLTWQETVALSGIVKTPAVDLGMDSVNSNLTIGLGQDRWVLLTLGPDFGPAVLIWGVLVVILILAVTLAKVPLTPLKGWHWFLLLIGLSQIPVASAFVVVAWLIMLGYRGEKPQQSRGYFNALQVLLGGVTLVSLILLFLAVEQGLLGSPEMQITGNQSTAYRLNWYQDRSPSQLPEAMVLSAPLLVYRVLMLAWSLWLAIALLNWLKWGWICFSNQGLWKKKPAKETTPLMADSTKKTSS